MPVELASYAPEPRVVCGDVVFGGLSIQKQKCEGECGELDFLSELGIAA